MALEFTELPVLVKPDDFFELSSRLYHSADSFTISQRHTLRPILETLLLKFESTMYLKPILKNLVRFLDEEIKPYCNDEIYPDNVSDYGTESDYSFSEQITTIVEAENEEAYKAENGFKEPEFTLLSDDDLVPPRMRKTLQSAPLNFDTLSVVSECPSLLSNNLPLEDKVPPPPPPDSIELSFDESIPTTPFSIDSPPALSSPNPFDQPMPAKSIKTPENLKSHKSFDFFPSCHMNASGDHHKLTMSPTFGDTIIIDEEDIEPEPLMKKRSFRKSVSRLVGRVSRVFRSKHKIESEFSY